MIQTSLPAERRYESGQDVIEKGEPAMEAFLIISGTAGVFADEKKLATLQEGEIFGEAALFKRSDYGATVRAEAPLTVQPITPDILDEKISGCDPMLRALIRMMMIRLRRANDMLAKADRNI